MSLTRRRLDERFESWGIFDGDLKVGALSLLPSTGFSMVWQWSCGFDPGCDPRTQMFSGREDTIDQAKCAFQKAWDQLRPQITPDMRDQWRRHNEFITWKYAMWKENCQMPSQSITGRSRCFCGDELSMADVPAHIAAKHSCVTIENSKVAHNSD